MRPLNPKYRNTSRIFDAKKTLDLSPTYLSGLHYHRLPTRQAGTPDLRPHLHGVAPLNYSSIVDFLSLPNVIYHNIVFAIGLTAGSFLNVVVYRLPLMLNRHRPEDRNQLNLCFPASHCTKCKHPLRFWQNVPLFSWLLLRGRCHYCHVKIPLAYPLSELACALLFLCMSLLFDAPFTLLSALILMWFLLALSLIDSSTYLLPDMLTLPLMWLGLLTHSVAGEVTLHDSLYGAVAGYLALWGLYWGYRILRDKEGMGYGDFKLLAALGAWVGWQSLPYLCILAALIGLSFTLVRVMVRKTTNEIPFGPCLALAGGVVYISQESNVFWLMFFSLTEV